MDRRHCAEWAGGASGAERVEPYSSLLKTQSCSEVDKLWVPLLSFNFFYGVEVLSFSVRRVVLLAQSGLSGLKFGLVNCNVRGLECAGVGCWHGGTVLPSKDFSALLLRTSPINSSFDRS